MNRKERRLKEKEKKREDNKKVEAMAWFKSLPQAKYLLIDSLIKIEARKENDSLLQAIDRCFSAAVFEELENLEWEDVKRIIDKSAELMLDDAHKMKELKEKLGGSYDMAVKKINEMGPEIEARIRELIEAGYNQKVSVKILIEEFKEISTAMLTNAYKKTKAIIKDEEKAKLVAGSIKGVAGESDKELEEALEYIFEDSAKDSEKEADTEEKEEKAINIQEEEKETNLNDNTDIKAIVENKSSKLRVVKEITKVVERTVQGEYGLYNIKGSVVTVDEEYSFENIEDVKSWANFEREELIKKIEELKLKIEHINSCENEAIEVIENFMDI